MSDNAETRTKIPKRSNAEWRRLLVDEIQAFQAEHGYAPTVRELAQRTGRSFTTVYGALTRLRDADIVDWVDDSNRTLHVTKWGMKAPDISL